MVDTCSACIMGPQVPWVPNPALGVEGDRDGAYVWVIITDNSNTATLWDTWAGGFTLIIISSPYTQFARWAMPILQIKKQARGLTCLLRVTLSSKAPPAGQVLSRAQGKCRAPNLIVS